MILSQASFNTAGKVAGNVVAPADTIFSWIQGTALYGANSLTDNSLYCNLGENVSTIGYVAEAGTGVVSAGGRKQVLKFSFWFTNLPAVQVTIAQVFQGYQPSFAATPATMALDGTGKLKIYSGTASGALQDTSTMTLAINTAYTLEWMVNTTLNTQELRIYTTSSQSASPVETMTGVTAAATSIDTVRVGRMNGVTWTSGFRLDDYKRLDDWWAAPAANFPWDEHFNGTLASNIVTNTNISSVTGTAPVVASSGLSGPHKDQKMCSFSSNSSQFRYLEANDLDPYTSGTETWERFYFRPSTTPPTGKYQAFWRTGGAVTSETLKPLIYGPMPRQFSHLNGNTHMGGIVADVNWSGLQTTNGGAIATGGTEFAEILNCLATGLPVRIRIHGGDVAPTWAKNLGTGPLNLHTVDDGSVLYTCPKWWESAFLTAFDDFMTKMAAAVIPSGPYAGQTLEQCPAIRQVAVNPATTEYAEPFIRGFGSGTTAIGGPNDGLNIRQILDAAGLDNTTYSGGNPTAVPANDTAAILHPSAITTGGKSRWYNYGWKTTRWYIPFNPYQTIRSDTGALSTDPLNWTLTAMQTISSRMGNQAVLANNSYRAPMSDLGATYEEMYENLNLTTGSSLSYQTASSATIGDVYRALPGKSAATDKEALTAAVEAALGIITEADDPLNILTMATVTANRADSVELPSLWSSAGITNTQLDTWRLFAEARAPASTDYTLTFSEYAPGKFSVQLWDGEPNWTDEILNIADEIVNLDVNQWSRFGIKYTYNPPTASQLTVRVFHGESVHADTGPTGTMNATGSTAANGGYRLRNIGQWSQLTTDSRVAVYFDEWKASVLGSVGPIDSADQQVPFINQWRFSEWYNNAGTMMERPLTLVGAVTTAPATEAINIGDTSIHLDTQTYGSRFAGDPGVGKIYVGWNTQGSSWTQHTEERARLESVNVPGIGTVVCKEGIYRVFQILRNVSQYPEGVDDWVEMGDAAPNVDIISVTFDPEGDGGETVIATRMNQIINGTYDPFLTKLAQKINNYWTNHGTVVHINYANEPESTNNSGWWKDLTRLRLARQASRYTHFFLLNQGCPREAFEVTSPTLFNETAREHGVRWRGAGSVLVDGAVTTNTRQDSINQYHPDWKGTITTTGGYWTTAWNPNPADFYQDGELDPWGYGRGPIIRTWSANSYCTHEELRPYVDSVNSKWTLDYYRRHKFSTHDGTFANSHAGGWQKFFRALYGTQGLPIHLGEWGYPVLQRSEAAYTTTPSLRTSDIQESINHVSTMMDDLANENVYGFSKWRQVVNTPDSSDQRSFGYRNDGTGTYMVDPEPGNMYRKQVAAAFAHARAIEPFRGPHAKPVGGVTPPPPVTTRKNALCQLAAVDFMAHQRSTFGPALTQTVADSIAGNYDIIIGQKGAWNGRVAGAKLAHPDTIIVYYVNASHYDPPGTTNAPSVGGTDYPTLSYHVNTLGNKLASRGFDTWLMNMESNADTNSWYQDRLRLSDLEQYRGYDGVFLDTVGTAPVSGGYEYDVVLGAGTTGNNHKPVEPGTVTIFTPTRWMTQQTGPICTAIQNYIQRTGDLTKKVWGNGIGTGNAYFTNTATDTGTKTLQPYMHGMMCELFIRAAEDGIASFETETEWKKHIDMLVESEKKNYKVVAITKVWKDEATSGVVGATVTQAQYDQWERYALASFLLGIKTTNSNCYFSYRTHKTTDRFDPPSMWSTVNLGDSVAAFPADGTPDLPYAKIDGVYQRDFIYGKVIVNSTGAAVSVPITGSYRRNGGAGATVTNASISIPAHDADLLVKI